MYVGRKNCRSMRPVPTIKNDSPDLRGVVNFGCGAFCRATFPLAQVTYKQSFQLGMGHRPANLYSIALLPCDTQMKSMLKMQRVAPQIRAFKSDIEVQPQIRANKMQKRLPRLQDRGVNRRRLLPMLIQFPPDCYYVLGCSRSRHAHWLGSPIFSKRSVNLLPILMVVRCLHAAHDAQAGMDAATKMLQWMMRYDGLHLLHLQAD